ncbi:MAG: hypothetical protein KatS3mg087_1558 [Patescibacteria group bacterium]|nr:MAG: hypothetical protein KatS3mg087_1558 [Patescibacteria group bacterium]
MNWLKREQSALFVPLSLDKLPLVRWGETGGVDYRTLTLRYPLSRRCLWALNLSSVDLVVFDLDVKNNPNVVSEFVDWLKRYGWFDLFREAFRVKTPSGGLHIYFRLPSRYASYRFRLIDALSGEISGVDVLSEGLVIIPPSRTRTGVYRVFPSSPVFGSIEDLPEAPSDLLDMLLSAFPKKSVEFRMRQMTPLDKRLLDLGLLDADRVESFLRSRGARFRRRGNDFMLCCLYHNDTHPSASISVQKDKIFYYCFSCSKEQNGELYHRFVRDYESWYSGESLASGKLLTLADAKRLASPELEQGYWGSLLQSGTVSVLGGYQKDFKSTFARNLTERLSRGKRLLGMSTERVGVLVLSYEESLAQYLSRVHWMAMDDSRVMLIPREKLEGYYSIQDAKVDPLESLRSWIYQSGAKVVIVDTGWNFFSAIAEARRWSMLGNSEVHRVYDELKAIATETQSAILLIWHIRKGVNLSEFPKDQVGIAMKDALLGVRAMSAGADSLWFVRRQSLSEDGIASMELYCEGRHAPLQLDFEIDAKTGRVLDMSESIMPDPPQQEDSGQNNKSNAQQESHSKRKTRRETDDINTTQDDDFQASNYRNGTVHAKREDYNALLRDDNTETGIMHKQVQEVKPMRAKSTVFEPLCFYYLSSTETPHDVVRLKLPDDADKKERYYVAVTTDAGDKKSLQRRSLYGTVLNYAIHKQTPFAGRPIKEIPKVSFDIETSHINPEYGQIRAIGVSYVCGEEKVLDSFVALDDSPEEERRIIQEFDKYLHEKDPEWLIGYNIFGFDIRYLLKRANRLGVQFTYLEKHYRRKKNQRYRYGSNFVETDVWMARSSPTRAIVDLYLLVLRSDLQASGQVPTNSLYDVYEYYMQESVLLRGLDKSQMASWSVEAVMDLVENDALMTARLAEKLLATEYSLSEYIPLPFSVLLYSGQGMRLENLLIADYIARGRAIRARYAVKEEYEGAISELVAPAGRYENLAKIDVVSLYPNIIIHYGIHPSNDYDARLPVLLRDFLAERLHYKKQKDSISQNRQLALKILINSAYGFMGASHFIFSDVASAAKVTEIGRKTLNLMRDVLLEYGCYPIEMDTDGIIFVRSGRESEVLERLRQLAPFDYDLEEYDLGLFLGAKNYLLVSKDSKRIVKGASLRSRAESGIGRELIRNLINFLVKGADTDDLKDLMGILRDKVRENR